MEKIPIDGGLKTDTFKKNEKRKSYLDVQSKKYFALSLRSKNFVENSNCTKFQTDRKYNYFVL